MNWLIGSFAVLFGGALLCLLAGRGSLARSMGPAVTLAGSALGLIPAVRALTGAVSETWRMPWAMPYGSFTVEMDALSAVFVIPILVVSALAAIYGAEYMRSSKKNMGASWFFYNLLVGSMVLVVVAQNAMLFLLAWEVMSLSSFFLVMSDGHRESVRRAGWTYLIATHIGTAFILVLFVLLGKGSGSLNFSDFSLVGSSAIAGVVFCFAVIGFGTKAGFMPFHVWLPEAHPAAPSYVSAVMSGVMIKTGIYGLLRILTFLGEPQVWWGWTLVLIGVVSGILGVLFALAQHDYKRLLAYHSVENIGIIALGLGIGLLGIAYSHPAMAAMGFAGALLHVINHAVFKSLLFLSAGSVLHAVSTRDIDHLGGLIKRMPITGLAFLVGSVAICGLPPLNGFVSEFMIYLGALGGVAGSAGILQPSVSAAGLIVIASLALIGGLALACFNKAFGIIFLGEPRSEHASHAHECGPAMWVPMLILAAACFVIGLSGPLMLGLLAPAVGIAMGPVQGVARQGFVETAWAGGLLWTVTAVSAGIMALACVFMLARYRLLRNRTVGETVTWDCGYTAPTPRMQYTASSFAQPIIRMFSFFLGTRRKFMAPSGYFPESSSFSSDTPDMYRERLYVPVFERMEGFMSRFRWIQHGRLNLYILCIILALVVLLVWKLR